MLEKKSGQADYWTVKHLYFESSRGKNDNFDMELKCGPANPYLE